LKKKNGWNYNSHQRGNNMIQ